MERVSNKFFAQRIIDGKAVSVQLRTNTSLKQEVDGGGNCRPNWNSYMTTEHDVIPKITGMCRLSGKAKMPQPYKWTWNGNEITFGNNLVTDSVNNISYYPSNGNFVQISGGTTYPIFGKSTVEEDGATIPCLYILRNLATNANTDNDQIGLEGSMEAGGAPLPFSVFLPVRIQELAGTGYSGYIEGDNYISDNSPKTDGEPSTALTAKLKIGANNVTNFKLSAYIEGNNSPIPGYNKKVTDNGSVVLTLKESQITDNVVLRFEFYVTENGADSLVDKEYFSVDDATDEMELQVSSRTYTRTDGQDVETGTGQGDVHLRDDQSVLFTFWMGHRQNPDQVYDGYSEFYVKLTDNKDAVIPKASFPDAYKQNASLPSDANFVKITTTLSPSGNNPDPVSKSCPGGKIMLSASFLESHNNGVGGIIIAE